MRLLQDQFWHFDPVLDNNPNLEPYRSLCKYNEVMVRLVKDAIRTGLIIVKCFFINQTAVALFPDIIASIVYLASQKELLKTILRFT